MALFELFIPGRDDTEFDITARIRAANWMHALRDGLAKLGQGFDAQNVLCDIHESSMDVTDPLSGRVFSIRELDDPDVSADSEPALMEPIPISEPVQIEPLPIPETNSVTLPSDQSFVSPEADRSFVAPEPDQSFVVPEGDRSVVVPEPEQSFVAPEVDQSFVAPESHQSFVAPEADQSVVAPEPEQSFVAPELDQSVVAPEPDQSFVAPEADQSFVAPEPDQSFVAPEVDQDFAVPPIQATSASVASSQASPATELAAEPSSLCEEGLEGRPEPLPVKRVLEDVIAELFDETADLHAEADLRNVAIRVLELAHGAIPSESGSVYVVDINRNDLHMVTARGLNADGTRFLGPMAQGRVGDSALESLSCTNSDSRRDPALFAEISERLGYDTYSILCVPARKNGRVFGALQLINKLDDLVFTDEDMSILDYISYQFADYLENREQSFV